MKFCEECWTRLIEKKIRADKLKVPFYSLWWDVRIFSLWSRYNKNNGKEQYWIQKICPNKKWYNWHTDIIDENQTLFSD